MKCNNVFIVAFALLLLHGGCFKEEYSYEGGTLPPTDTTSIEIPQPAPVLIGCINCKPAAPLPFMHWTFQIEAEAFCGTISNAVLSPDRTAMTFFGPSLCTVDTGLIMTAFFSEPFDQDRSEVTATRAIIQYYIKNAADDVFHSKQSDPFTLVVDHFDTTSRTAAGHFSGFASRPDSTQVPVQNGSFQVLFE